jgi:hypothetical protein
MDGGDNMTKTMLLIALAALVTLAGCAEYRAVKVGLADHGAQGAREVRETAEWTICQAITVGEWVRAYGDNPNKANGWRQLCGKEVTSTPTEPKP